jgi:hypothetical protein
MQVQMILKRVTATLNPTTPFILDLIVTAL